MYVVVVHYWRTQHTTNAVLTQVSEANRQTMELFATRIPPAVRALRLEATLAAGLIGDTLRVNAVAARLRAMAQADGPGDGSVTVVRLDSAGNSLWSSPPRPHGEPDRVVARRPIPGGGSMLLRRVGERYLLDVAVPTLAGRDEMAAIRVPPRSLFYGPLQTRIPNDSAARTSLFALDGDAVVLVATEGYDTLPSLGPWKRDRMPRAFAAAFGGGEFGGRDTDLWGREVTAGASPLDLPGMIIVRQRSISSLRALARASFWLDSIIVSVGSALLVLMMVGVYRFARMRRAQDLASLRSDFVAGVSHELRTPLAQIRLFAQLLREGTVQTEVQVERSLRVIDSEARRLTFLVDNVLNFARIENDVRHPSPVPTDVARVVEEAIEAFGPLAETRQARVEASVSPGLRVLADPRALHQIILNFLDNALKYGPAGQTVRVTATAAGTHVRLCVDDEGPGVPVRERTMVWRQFYRLVGGSPDAKTPEAGGTGIGLAVVSELVAAYGGRVAIEDAPGGGARFVAELPSAG